MKLKRLLGPAVLVTALLSTGSLATATEIPTSERVVRITASMFQFQPNSITVRKGVPVTLELISDDLHHGFKLSEFHVRADAKPGAVERLRFVPDKIGRFTFICDAFCGDGHEEMSGTLVVTE